MISSKILLTGLCLLALTAVSPVHGRQKATVNKSRHFNLPPPSKNRLSRPIALWATYYNLHHARDRRRGRALLDRNGRPLGVRLSRRDWCYAAMEGSVRVRLRRGGYKVYNFDRTGPRTQVSCRRYFPRLSPKLRAAMSKSRFRPATGRFGDGVANFVLVPFRTIAVDPNLIPYGSVIYVPAARGTRFRHRGRWYRHDGYFYAADRGGAIKGGHIDVFTGSLSHNPFAFVGPGKKRFSAYRVNQRRLGRQLRDLHRWRHRWRHR